MIRLQLGELNFSFNFIYQKWYYNRLACKIAIANLGGSVERKNKMKGKERKETILSYSNSYFYHNFILITITSKEKRKRN